MKSSSSETSTPSSTSPIHPHSPPSPILPELPGLLRTSEAHPHTRPTRTRTTPAPLPTPSPSPFKPPIHSTYLCPQETPQANSSKTETYIEFSTLAGLAPPGNPPDDEERECRERKSKGDDAIPKEGLISPKFVEAIAKVKGFFDFGAYFWVVRRGVGDRKGTRGIFVVVG
ncbi:hypothetical protein ACMFMF_010247 [Clarireedia jacksonii]